MRTWLDHNDAGSTQFETMRDRDGFILVRVEFATEPWPKRFAASFPGARSSRRASKPSASLFGYNAVK